MLTKIREILLTQYIGTVVIALLGCNAAITLITTILQDVFWFVRHQRLQSEMGASDPFRYDDLAYSVLTVLLYLSVAYLLSRWLFPLPSPSGVAEGADDLSDGPSHS
jgi:hypothetical protein